MPTGCSSQGGMKDVKELSDEIVVECNNGFGGARFDERFGRLVVALVDIIMIIRIIHLHYHVVLLIYTSEIR